MNGYSSGAYGPLVAEAFTALMEDDLVTFQALDTRALVQALAGDDKGLEAFVTDADIAVNRHGPLSGVTLIGRDDLADNALREVLGNYDVVAIGPRTRVAYGSGDDYRQYLMKVVYVTLEPQGLVYQEPVTFEEIEDIKRLFTRSLARYSGAMEEFLPVIRTLVTNSKDYGFDGELDWFDIVALERGLTAIDDVESGDLERALAINLLLGYFFALTHDRGLSAKIAAVMKAELV